MQVKYHSTSTVVSFWPMQNVQKTTEGRWKHRRRKQVRESWSEWNQASIPGKLRQHPSTCRYNTSAWHSIVHLDQRGETTTDDDYYRQSPLLLFVTGTDSLHCFRCKIMT